MASITARQAYGHRKAWDVHVLHQEPESFHSSGKETVHVHHCKATARLSQWSRSRKAQLREAMEDSSLHSTAPKWGELGRNIQKLNRVLQIFRVFQQNLLYFQRICRANAAELFPLEEKEIRGRRWYTFTIKDSFRLVNVAH